MKIEIECFFCKISTDNGFCLYSKLYLSLNKIINKLLIYLRRKLKIVKQIDIGKQISKTNSTNYCDKQGIYKRKNELLDSVQVRC